MTPEFPPPMITRWVHWEGVTTEALVAELRYWADYMEQFLDEQRARA